MNHKKLQLLLLLFSATLLIADLRLTSQEQEFIKNHPTINLASSVGYEPFLIQNSDSTISGHDRELLDIITQKTGLKFTITLGNWKQMQEKAKNREYDGLSSVGYVKEREKFYNPSSAYLHFMTLVITKKDNPKNILTLDDLEKKTVAIERGNVLFERIMRETGKDVNILYYDSMQDMLKAVVSNKADFTIMDETVFYIAKQIGLSHMIEVPFSIGEPFDVLFWFRDDYPELVSIVNKALESIDSNTKMILRDKWFSKDKNITIVDILKEIDYELVLRVLAAILVIILFIFYRQYELKKINKRLRETIKKELEASRKKDNLIFQQNKMASLGQMIGTIAHQWRQPLSELSMSQNMTLRQNETGKNISPEQLSKIIKDEQKIVKFMSKTINTFQDFYNDTIEDEEYKVSLAYEDVKLLLQESINLKNISIKEDIDDLYIVGSKNYLSQVILSILQNSIYFLDTRKIQNPTLFISIKNINEKIVLSIEDNARGVDLDAIEQIFQYSFSKRDKNEKSTGLGLYIAKLIVEEKLDGFISAINTKKGLRISIHL